MRSTVVALALVSCSVSTPPRSPPSVPDAGATQSSIDAGSASVAPDAGQIAAADADAATPDAGAPEPVATVPDAGPADASVSDGGPGDAGSVDGGIGLDCIPGGMLVPAWKLTGFLDPWGRFGTGYGVLGDDGAGDFVLARYEWSHSGSQATFTVTPAGQDRAAIANVYESMFGETRGTYGYAKRGVIVRMDDNWPSSLNGTAQILDADGRLLLSWDAGTACAKLPAGCVLQDLVSASSGEVTVFGASGHATDQTGYGALTALRTDGQVLWQRVITGASWDVLGVDDSAIAFVALQGANVEAVSPDGVTMYELARSPSFAVGAGRVYRGDRAILNAADGTVAATIPFDPSGYAILTGSRIAVADSAGVLHSVDLATGQSIWSRKLSQAVGAQPFRPAANDAVLLVGEDQRIHLVAADGKDLVSCAVPGSAPGSFALLGGSLVVSAGIQLGAFDVPIVR